MPTQVIMPQLGESVVEGTVTKWLKQEGEHINADESLLEVNTDKVDTEIPSPAAGSLLKIVIGEGITVKAGTIIAWIGEPGEIIPVGVTSVDLHAAAAPTPTAAQVAAPASGRSRELGFISPVVAKMAAEHNLDLSLIHGTGEGGRITKRDVLSFIEKGAPAVSSIPEEKAAWETPGEGDLFRPTELQFAGGAPGMAAPPPRQPAITPPPIAAPHPSSLSGERPGERSAILPGDQLVPHTTLRRAIAEHMVHSKHTSPHVTTVMEADLTAVVAHRAVNKVEFTRGGVNLTFTPYFIAAIVAGLKAFPAANSSWSEEGLLLHGAINIGMATSLGQDGLIVPVIKGADGLSLLGLARAVNDLAERARARKLQPDEVKGGTFTITNHGTSGSLFATPVISQPQCGILGVGAIQKRVVVINDAIAIRPMVYLSLTFDHRILDGAGADGFLAKVVDTLQNWS